MAAWLKPAEWHRADAADVEDQVDRHEHFDFFQDECQASPGACPAGIPPWLLALGSWHASPVSESLFCKSRPSLSHPLVPSTQLSPATRLMLAQSQNTLNISSDTLHISKAIPTPDCFHDLPGQPTSTFVFWMPKRHRVRNARWGKRVMRQAK